MDTIFALASAQGKAGVSVFRLSGPKAHLAVERLCGPLPAPRYAALRKVRFEGEILDEALVLIFSENASFTGEACAELQVHGGVATVGAVLGALAAQPGLRLAEPGEFTRRALENGKLDLTQVEGLADLIDAETESQRRQAQRVMSGALGLRAEGWRRDLVRAAALIEATIDFVDEDVPVDVVPEVRSLIDGLLTSFRAELSGAAAAEQIRTGFEVAIVGAPNVGKSTLLNCLAGRDAAITSEIAGTTRDIVEVRLDIAGLSVTLLDTAGLRETEDTIEKLGIERALHRAQQADLRVFLISQPGEDLSLTPVTGDIVLLAKGDLRAFEQGAISGKTGVGVDQLVAQIGQELAGRTQGSGLLVRERHRRAVAGSLARLERARAMLQSGAGLELAAAELRGANVAIEALTGRIGVESLLGEIFSSFCIGK